MEYTKKWQKLNNGLIQYQYFMGFCAGYKIPYQNNNEVLIKKESGKIKTFKTQKNALDNAKKIESKSLIQGSPFTRPFYYWSYKSPKNL